METSYHENYIKQLERLLKVVIKSQRKYSEASDNIESPELKNLFNTRVTERQQIAVELQEHITKLGGHSDELSYEGNPHHFNSTKSGTSSKHDQSVLESIRNSEQEALDAYDDTMQGTILENLELKTLMSSHRLSISEAFGDLDSRYFSMFKSSEPY